MGRVGAAVVGMELMALVVAVLAFGWPVLLVGVPLLVVTLTALAVVRSWELVRRRLERRRANRWDPASAQPGGLMSGFFEVSAVGEQPALPPVDVPALRAARGWAWGLAGSWAGGRAAGGVGGRPSGSAAGARRSGLGPRPVQRVLALSERLPRRGRR
jgi:hypothetical protein